MPLGLKARLELRKPVVHERPMSGSPLHQSLVKVGINIEAFSLRTHTMAALYAFTGWEDPLSFSEWRLQPCDCQWFDQLGRSSGYAPQEI